MCLAVPARVVEKRADGMARVDLTGAERIVSLDLLPEAEVGDFVIVHVGFAIERLDPREAEERLALFAEAGLIPPPQDREDGT